MHILVAAHFLIKDNYSMYSYKNLFHYPKISGCSNTNQLTITKIKVIKINLNPFSKIDLINILKLSYASSGYQKTTDTHNYNY